MLIDRAGADTWDGDLHHVSTKTWLESESDVVAIMTVRDGEVWGFTNLRFVNPSNARLVWLWIRHAAAFRPPMDVLYADDLARLDSEFQAEEA